MAGTDYPAFVAQLDLPTKVTLLTGASAFTLAPCPAIGLSEVRLSDGPTGVRGLKFSGGRTVTLFPNATLLASAWSEDTAYEVGRLLAEEAMAQQIHVVLGPTINLHRSLLGGRLFEAYSEDPLLTGKLAAAYVRGLQESRVGACLKHLVANESETDRNTVNSVVAESTLRELYLLPFEIAVAEADSWSIMAAYNDVNGVAATEQQHVNNEIVKGEWGYDGLIMSDWFATKTAAPAANGGLDLVMPGPNGPWGETLITAVRVGEVEESTIDDHLIRLLRLADRVGAVGTPRDYPDDLPVPDSTARREQLTRLAAEGMTVLTNRDDVLPLDRAATVALIGRHAVDTVDMGGGSAQVNPPYQVSVAEGLATRLGNRAETSTVEATGADDVEGSVSPMAGVGLFGIVARSAPRDPNEMIAAAAEAAAAADVAVVVVGLTEEQETESVDKATLRLPGQQDDLVRRSPRRRERPWSWSTPRHRSPCRGATRSTPYCGRVCRARRGATLSPHPFSARSSRPAGSSRRSPWMTPPPPHGRSRRSTARSPTRKVPTSATAGTTPGGRRHRRSGSATAWATPRGDTRNRGCPSTESRRRSRSR
jgi:beta-glucosidase-like glycosyl hydrolase